MKRQKKIMACSTSTCFTFSFLKFDQIGTSMNNAPNSNLISYLLHRCRYLVKFIDIFNRFCSISTMLATLMIVLSTRQLVIYLQALHRGQRRLPRKKRVVNFCEFRSGFEWIQHSFQCKNYWYFGKLCMMPMMVNLGWASPHFEFKSYVFQ